MRLLAKISTVLLAATLALSLSPAPAPAAPAGFVYAQGNKLMLDGHPWRAIGVNFWDLEAFKVLANDPAGCYYQHPDLDSYFDASFKAIAENTHATTVRTFAFQQFYSEAGRTWDSTDKLLYYAQKYNVRVVPVLGTQFTACGESRKTPAWYHCPIPAAVASQFPNDVTFCNAHSNVAGYKIAGITGPYDVSFRDYVKAAAARYKDNPTIAFWQLMNESSDVGAASAHDDTALVDFSKDMVSAIRSEAGDVNHLINLGTFGGVGVPRPGYGYLLPCNDANTPDGGGCNDLAEAHEYSTAVPMTGVPSPYSSAHTGFRFLGVAPQCPLNQGDVFSWVDGWQSATDPTTHQPNPAQPALASGIPACARSWQLRVNVPANSSITELFDDVRVQIGAQVQVFTFEDGTDGFSSTDPHVVSLTQSTERAHTGGGALRIDLQNTTASPVDAFIDAPAFPSLPVNGAASIQAWPSTNFTTPIPDGPPLIDSAFADMHDAIIRNGKPFFVGEVGIPAHVPGANPLFEAPSTTCGSTSCNLLGQVFLGCSGAAGNPQPGTRADRAQKYDQMMAFQLDAWHQSSGWVAWDWKDPSVLTSMPSGVQQTDQMINCYSIEPGDPAALILQKYADLTPNNPPLPAPAALGTFTPTLMVDARYSTLTHGATITVPVRMVRGGNAYPNVTVSASGACTGTAITDALGYAALSCGVATTPGSYTLTLAPNPATCSFADCAGITRQFAVTVS